MNDNLMIAALLGLLEGLTEFIPVSSTGHLLLAGHFLGFESAGRTFEVVIQLGAVLAILTVYSARLWQVFSTAHNDAASRRFVVSVLLAFLPAVVIGVMAHGFIKSVLFETPMLIAIMLVLGGIVAAVLGVVKTMGSIDQPPSVLGGMIGGALVGTFMGVFLAYGFVAPLAQRLGEVTKQDLSFYDVIKSVLIAGLHQHATNLCVEVGRQAAPDHLRPSFVEVENALREMKKAA